MSDDLHTLAGAYVLDALDDEERTAFEAYLAESPGARAEVDSLREAAGLLGSAAATTPPAGMKATVMSRIDTVRQDRPVVDLEDRSDAAAGAPAADGASRPWTMRLAWSAAAAVTLIALALGAAIAQINQRVDDIQRQSEAIGVVLAADDAQQISTPLEAGGQLSALISPSTGSAVVVGHGMRALDEDQMYALWAITDGTPRPAGELIVDQPSPVEAGTLEAIAVTVEPRGPLSEPTGDIEGSLSV